jgi:hypothetical protein
LAKRYQKQTTSISNHLGYYRKAKALEALNKKDELLETLNIGLNVEPKNKDLLDILKMNFPQQYKQRLAQAAKTVPT